MGWACGLVSLSKVNVNYARKMSCRNMLKTRDLIEFTEKRNYSYLCGQLCPPDIETSILTQDLQLTIQTSRLQVIQACFLSLLTSLCVVWHLKCHHLWLLFANQLPGLFDTDWLSLFSNIRVYCGGVSHTIIFNIEQLCTEPKYRRWSN